ncbi:16762_t:CDS:1, partial [Rhizophagus irregularis]
IVIHQQQLEGLNNCYDIKIHPNMGTELQQARIQFSGINNRIEKVTQDELHHIRKEMRNSNRRDNSLESSFS